MQNIWIFVSGNLVYGPLIFLYESMKIPLKEKKSFIFF